MTTQLRSEQSTVESPSAGVPQRFNGLTRYVGADLAASLVVFLVALPLCVGVAVAAGVPVELGILTGVVGGLVVGVLPGSALQVSGPSPGAIAVVAAAVSQHGLSALGVIVLGAGVVQVLFGLVGVASWFRAICPSVVYGMLAGIGLVLILGEIYPVGGLGQPESTVGKFVGVPELLSWTVTTRVGLSSLTIATITVVLMLAWQRMPRPARIVPGAVIAVVVTSGVTYFLHLPLKTIKVGSLLAALNPPMASAWSHALAPGILGSVVTFALIASAESLFSAAAVDEMHDGVKTHYNKELIAQGVGNIVCGSVGALPMAAVIIRSSANIHAGARTKLSRVLHGMWLLLFVVLLPGMLNFIPMAVLAALLVHAGWKLLSLRHVAKLAREHRWDAVVLVLTAVTIVATDLLTGTLVGLAAAVVKTAFELSRLSVRAEHTDEHLRVELGGNATFLRLPRLLDHLERLPATSSVHLDLSTVRHLDRACRQAVESWAAQRRRRNCSVEVVMPGS